MTAELPDVHLSPGAPFGIYVHVPFCITRCGYCDFNTYTPAELGGVNPDAWLLVLRAELELAAARLGTPTVQTVFVGGGTPSLLGGERLSAVLQAVRDNFELAADVESRRKPTRNRRGPRCSRRCDRPGTTEFRWACSRWHRGCWPPSIGCTRRVARWPPPVRRW